MNQQPNHSLDHRIFRSDSKLTPHEINSLLGLKVVIEKDQVVDSHSGLETLKQVVSLAVITLVLASAALIGSMYQLKIGPFHESAVFAGFEIE